GPQPAPAGRARGPVAARRDRAAARGARLRAAARARARAARGRAGAVPGGRRAPPGRRCRRGRRLRAGQGDRARRQGRLGWRARAMAMTAAAKPGWRRRIELLARPRHPETLPVSLDRRRVYILPTAFGWFFLLLLLAMSVGALNYNNNPALLLALLLAGAANTSLFAAHLQLSGLQVVAVGAEPVAAGKPLRLDVHARAGDDRMRRGLRVECLGGSGVLSLEGGAGTATLVVPTSRRGWLDIGRLRVSTTRPLGLARAWAWIWPRTPVLVYPAPEAHGPPLPEGAGDSAQARMHPAGDDVHHLRAYRRGDARRAIAWKPSARHGALLVREYEQP